MWGWFKILFYGWVTTIPFGYRVLLISFVPGVHEYETAWLYLNDFFLVGFVGLGIYLIGWREGKKILKNFRLGKYWAETGLVIFLISAAAGVLSASLPGLAGYQLLRLTLNVSAAVMTGYLLRKKLAEVRVILGLVAGLAGFQALVAFWQFKLQHSLGLALLGEPFLSRSAAGMSKIIISNSEIVRAYGTFLHPNILAAFLVIGFGALLYFFAKEQRRVYQYGFLALLYLVSLGLITTMSRSGWIALIALAAVGVGWLAIKNFRRAVWLGAVLMIMAAAAVWPMRDFVFPRAQVSRYEEAVTARLSYIDLGKKIIKDNPAGVGLGNQVYYTYKNGLYRQAGMNQFWLWQPIHNLYLIMGAETGIFGLAVWLAVVLGLIIRGLKCKNIYPIMILAGLLTFGLFDHFLWTIAAGQAILWLAIGLLLANKYNKETSGA